MLGFATVDLSVRDHSLTVWLTSPGINTEVAHTNAVRFDLAEDEVSRRAWSMTCDRFVIMTDRTPRDHAVFAKWGVAPSDLAALAKLTTVAQETVMAAFTEHAAKPGKADLMEPTMPSVPSPLNQAALDAEAPEQLTLALANQVMRIWIAWLATERERIKRWTYMPGGRKDETPAVLPAEFTQQNVVQPIRAWLP
jgi:hypothetical protein